MAVDHINLFLWSDAGKSDGSMAATAAFCAVCSLQLQFIAYYQTCHCLANVQVEDPLFSSIMFPLTLISWVALC